MTLIAAVLTATADTVLRHSARPSPSTTPAPRRPPGVDSYTDMLISWVKYGVAALIIGAGFLSIGAMVIGKLGSMSRAAQIGASGLVLVDPRPRSPTSRSTGSCGPSSERAADARPSPLDADWPPHRSSGPGASCRSCSGSRR